MSQASPQIIAYTPGLGAVIVHLLADKLAV